MKIARYIVILLLVLALATGVAWRMAWGPFAPKDSGKAQGPQVVRVTAATVERKDVPLTVELVATFYPNQSVAVKSRLDSLIAAVKFRDGDHVQQGDVLFVLDDRSIKTQWAQMSANLKRDEAQLVNAKSQYERSIKLAERGYATREKLDQDKAAFDAQEATVAATRAALRTMEVQLDYTVIKAPITGRAGTINATAGNNVKANDAQPLVTINQVAPALVQFAVPQRYFDAVKASMAAGDVTVQARRPDSGIVAVGHLGYIDNAIDASSGTFVARAVFDNADEKLWPGMFVNVSLGLGAIKDAVVFPATALQGGQDSPFVFVVDATSGKAARRGIVVERMVDDRVVVKSGVAEGDRVITDGLLRVTDGATVEVAP